MLRRTGTIDGIKPQHYPKGAAMYRILLPLFLVTGNALAHPGHGAPSLHLHDWQWNHWALVLGMVAIAGFAAWRSR